MRRLLLAALLALAPVATQAQAISVGQTPLGGGGSLFGDGTETVTFAGNPAANSAVIVMTGLGGGTNLNSVTGLGATWTTPVTLSSASGDVSVSCTNDPNGSSAAVTMNTDAEASGNARYLIVNYTQSGGTGFDCANLHVASTAYSAHASPHPSGSTTPSTANNVCTGFLRGSSGSYTVEAGWTGVTVLDDARGIAGYLIQTSATAQSFDPTSLASEDVGVMIACLDSLGGGGGTPVLRGTLLGVLP